MHAPIVPCPPLNPAFTPPQRGEFGIQRSYSLAIIASLLPVLRRITGPEAARNG
jgi:hypothetical protein